MREKKSPKAETVETEFDESYNGFDRLTLRIKKQTPLGKHHVTPSYPDFYIFKFVAI